MTVQRVFVDADVLFSRTLRDWLFHAVDVTHGGVFAAHTSEDVLNEALARLRDQNPTWDGAQIARIRAAVRTQFDEIVEDFDGSVPFPGSDPHDRHVHAAAMATGATMLLTNDGGFFDCADQLVYEPIRPDDFFVLLDDSVPHLVAEMTIRQVMYWEKRHGSPKLSERLRAAGCPGFAARVEAKIAGLAGPRAARRYAASRQQD